MLRQAAGFVAVLSLITCLAYPIMYFLGGIDAELMKSFFLVASIVWLVTASLWFRDREPNEPDF